jgi:hypothetical protein
MMFQVASPEEQISFPTARYTMSAIFHKIGCCLLGSVSLPDITKGLGIKILNLEDYVAA